MSSSYSSASCVLWPGSARAARCIKWIGLMAIFAVNFGRNQLELVYFCEPDSVAGPEGSISSQSLSRVFQNPKTI